MREVRPKFVLWICLLAMNQPIWACEESPGPNTADPAQVGEFKAKFDKGPRQARVHFNLLQEPLAKIAKKCGEDLIVNSGFRTCAENQQNPGRAKRSFHLRGMAADISFCKGKGLAEMFKILAQAGCGGIGCYPTFVQCDVGPKRQWGPCPGNRLPPDEPQKDKKDDQQPPPEAYDSKTPSEPGSPTAPPPASARSFSPSSITPSSPPGQASYPQSIQPMQVGKGQIHDMRDQTKRPSMVAAKGNSEPLESSTLTKNDERPLGHETRTEGAAGPAGALNPLSLDGSSFGQRSSVKLSHSSAFGSSLAGGSLPGIPLDSARSSSSSAVKLEGANPYADSNGVNGGGRYGTSGSRSEALTPFGTGDLPKSNLGINGGVVAMDDEIRRIQEREFAAGDRAPASEANEESLFFRAHATHERCLRRGILTRGGF